MKRIALYLFGFVPAYALATGEVPLCEKDLKKFCKDVTRSETKACLKKHARGLSTVCKSKVAKARKGKS